MMALLTTGSFAGGGYLPKIGPSTLRLQPQFVAVDTTRLLPPLQMEDPKPVESPPDETVIGPPLPEDPEPEEKEMVQIDELESEMPPVVEWTENAPAQQQQVPLTPQMFMRFFSENGDREAVVQAPVEFTPPSASPGSRATYIVR